MLLKTCENLGQIPAPALASMLIERQRIIDQYIETVRELAQIIATFERRYDVSSDDLRTGLSSGTITETPEIIEWLVAIERLRMATKDWPQVAASQQNTP